MRVEIRKPVLIAIILIIILDFLFNGFYFLKAYNKLAALDFSVTDGFLVGRVAQGTFTITLLIMSLLIVGIISLIREEYLFFSIGLTLYVLGKGIISLMIAIIFLADSADFSRYHNSWLSLWTIFTFIIMIKLMSASGSTQRR
jgi:hypothetical protein